MSLNLLRSKLNERKKFRESFLASHSQVNTTDAKKETNGKIRLKKYTG